jgi:hypothetical protein
MVAARVDRRCVRRALLALSLALGSLALSRGASAAPEAHLVYARGRGAETCPDESALRRAVEARMGRDPFVASAPLAIRVDVLAEGGRLRGRVAFEKDGVERGAQVIDEVTPKDGSPARCDDLVASIALAVAVALDASTLPMLDAPPEPAAKPEPKPEAKPEPEPRLEAKPEPKPEPKPETVPEAPTPPVAPIRAQPLSLWVAPGMRASIGMWSHVAVGPDLLVELRRGRLGLGLEGRYDLPVTVNAGSGVNANVDRAMASLVPCVHLGWLSPCAVADFGVTRARGASGGEIEPAYVALGARAMLDVPLSTRLHLLGMVDTVGILTPVQIKDGASIPESNPVEASATIALLVSIL